MTRSASYISLSIAALFLAITVSPAFAVVTSTVSVSNNGEGAKNDVRVETNTGGNTICQNGKCTTTSNNGKSTVCVNGVCNTSDEDVNYESSDGNTKVNIQNNNERVTVVNEVNGDQGTLMKRSVPTITPTLFKEEKTTQTDVLGAKDEAKKETVEEEKGFNLATFFKTEFEQIKKLFTLDFIFGK